MCLCSLDCLLLSYACFLIAFLLHCCFLFLFFYSWVSVSIFFYYYYYQYYICRSAHHPFSSTQLGFRYFPRWLRRPPNFRRVLEYWSRRVTYLPCMRWWYPSCRSSRVRKYVSWRTHVCAHQNLAQVHFCALEGPGKVMACTQHIDVEAPFFPFPLAKTRNCDWIKGIKVLKY